MNLIGGPFERPQLYRALRTGLYSDHQGGNMNSCTITIAAALLAASAVLAASPAAAQNTTWQNYRCADGTEFVVGFFGYDKRAHMQVDGKAMTLEKRIALGGS